MDWITPQKTEIIESVLFSLTESFSDGHISNDSYQGHHANPRSQVACHLSEAVGLIAKSCVEVWWSKHWQSWDYLSCKWQKQWSLYCIRHEKDESLNITSVTSQINVPDLLVWGRWIRVNPRRRRQWCKWWQLQRSSRQTWARWSSAASTAVCLAPLLSLVWSLFLSVAREE